MIRRRWDPESRLPLDARQRMVDETSAFLSWALSNGYAVPRIPRRRVSEGGFTELLRQPGARAAVAMFWDRTLGRLMEL